MKIIPYEDRFRDDMIFMVLQAKDALGRIPKLNTDLLNVQENYLDPGDSFYLAIDDNDRVIGCIGFSRIAGTEEAFLHRLYVKASEKHKGIGTALLNTVEADMKKKGIVVSRVHLGDRYIYYESYSFYPKNGYSEYAPSCMMKAL